MPSPGYASIDLSVQKSVRIKESKFELRIEAFNVANKVNFAPPVTDMVSRDFGRSQAASNVRIIRLAVRYRF